MNQFCEMKGIKREFSVARTPQQNGVAERKNRTLIEAARTMLVDSKLPTTFWAEAVNTACYVLNKVLVIKPHNKTPYELLRGRPLLIDFIKPFWCLVTILNTKDHLGKFDGKADEGYFSGYYVVSKLMRVPVAAGIKTNGLLESKDNMLQVKLRRKKEPEQDTPVSTAGPSFDTVVPSTPVNTIGPSVLGTRRIKEACGDEQSCWLLRDHYQEEVKTASTPMETNKALIKDEEAEDMDVHLYRSMIGLLMYLTASRPDIMFAVCAYVITGVLKFNTAQLQLNVAKLKHQLVLPVQVPAAEEKVKTVNGVRQLQALIDKKKMIITESSIRSDLHLEDAGGTDCLPTATIFEELARMGFINQQLGDMSHHKKIYVNPFHTKKIFANMKREGKDFSGRITPLFDTMMVQASEEVGEDSDHPTDSNQIPIVDQPSTSSQPKKKQMFLTWKKDNLIKPWSLLISRRRVQDKLEKSEKEDEFQTVGGELKIFDSVARLTLVNETQEAVMEDLMFNTEFWRCAWSYFYTSVEETLAQTLRISRQQPKAKGIVFHDWKCNLMGKSYDEIQELFDKEMNRVNTFMAMSLEAQESNEKKVEGSEEKAKSRRKKSLGEKRAVKEHQQESSKRQKLEGEIVGLVQCPLISIDLKIKYPKSNVLLKTVQIQLFNSTYKIKDIFTSVNVADQNLLEIRKRSGYHQKDRKPKPKKTKLTWNGKDCAKIKGQSQKCQSRAGTEEYY
ncbi:ribonuclease H-like domain-containing protein [Tanacetum coccineum]